MVDLPAEEAGPVAYELLGGLGALDGLLFAGDCDPLRDQLPVARIALTWAESNRRREERSAWLRPEYFNPYFQLLTRGRSLSACTSAGIGVSVWTVDEEGHAGGDQSAPMR